MNKADIIKFWQNGSKESFDTAEDLFKLKRYNFALFFCHLSIEKYIKSLIIKNTNKPPLMTHDLLDLAKQAELDLDIEKKETLKEITDFNLDARYDDYQLKFYRKATKVYTIKFFKIIKETLKWLKSN